MFLRSEFAALLAASRTNGEHLKIRNFAREFTKFRQCQSFEPVFSSQKTLPDGGSLSLRFCKEHYTNARFRANRIRRAPRFIFCSPECRLFRHPRRINLGPKSTRAHARFRLHFRNRPARTFGRPKDKGGQGRSKTWCARWRRIRTHVGREKA